jgi:tetratricopeptide (TPR) repeat protein
VTVFEGTVLAENPQGALTLTDGQSAAVARGGGPVLRVVARPREAVQWALHYPLVLYLRPEEITGAAELQEMLRRSLAAYREGDVQRAFEEIAGALSTISDPRFLAYRAQLALAVGRVDEARADLDRALAVAPEDADALALQTIIAVVQNDEARALELARRTVAAAPRSATAHVALSYAQQARFELDAARSSLERAVAVDPQNALAWARLAELHASFGELGRSLDAARTAEALAPELSRTQTVLGFAHLREVDLSAARRAFERAIALDSADPLPRLGFGLTIIRDGDLGEGRREIEIAASLAPNDALIRSYLGKAYYEEKRQGLDEREYAVAKELDPRDPTPWFYDAIAKQTTNRPVEALQNLERAIELNDDRAIFRSRLLLDADLAARSASLARIYSDLGFQQLALVEGWKAVNTDPASEAAHRLLADSYAALPRHEVARVSELLQAQLLQPINITPIQPRLAESNLFLLSAAGPGTLSFQEFNPLFNRDRLAFQLNGVAGERDTLGVEPIVAGIYRNLSFSVGYTHAETEGFRVDNDQDEDIVNAFVQVELTSRTSVQAEFRYRDSERGDLLPHFFPDDAGTVARSDERWETYRVGARHSFTPASVVLASAMHRAAQFGADREQDSVGGELQHLYRSRFLDVVSGIGYVDIGKLDGARHANAYAYARSHLPWAVTLTLGLGGDLLRSTTEENTEQLNPKVGLTWSPVSGTTLRAAAFRVLKRTLITDQTLEPTQVGGFNQFFDDANVTKSWRFGIGVDHKLSQDTFVGVEGTRRDLRVPYFLELESPAPEIPTITLRDKADWTEHLARAYVLATPARGVAVRAEYFFERLIRDEENALGVRSVDTHRVPLGVACFSRWGPSLSVTATYYDQSGRFGQSFSERGFRTGGERFWVVDSALSWRFPKRYGIIAVGATNLLDERFRLFEYSGTSVMSNPTVQPSRAAFVRATLAAP